jgi:hypothetical protein
MMVENGGAFVEASSRHEVVRSPFSVTLGGGPMNATATNEWCASLYVRSGMHCVAFTPFDSLYTLQGPKFT